MLIKRLIVILISLFISASMQAHTTFDYQGVGTILIEKKAEQVETAGEIDDDRLLYMQTHFSDTAQKHAEAFFYIETLRPLKLAALLHKPPILR